MNEPFETRLQNLAQEFSYPPTPRIAEKVMTHLRPQLAPRFAARRLQWSLAIAIVLLAGLMAVPPVRAAVLDFIRIGVVRIFPAPAPTIEAPRTATSESILPLTASPSLIPFLEQMMGETNLDAAQNSVGFPIPLPIYPTDIGEPDRVFVQDTHGWMVILVWLEPNRPSQVRMSLHLIEEGSWVLDKFQPAVIQETSVNGLYAIWAEGPYPLLTSNGSIEWTRLIEGHVLIWAEGGITYRLETSLSLEQAVRIAESIR